MSKVKRQNKAKEKRGWQGEKKLPERKMLSKGRRGDKEGKDGEQDCKQEGGMRRGYSEEEKVIKINRGDGNEEQMDGRDENQ